MDVEVQKALIAAGSAVIGIILTQLLAKRAVESRAATPTPTNPDAEKVAAVPDRTPLSQYSGEQNEFTTLVVADNAQLRETLARLEDKLDAKIDELTAKHERLRSAVRNYLALLADAWPGPGHMPRPSDRDFAELDPLLPTRNPRRDP
jgi:hypothetical protein